LRCHKLLSITRQPNGGAYAHLLDGFDVALLPTLARFQQCVNYHACEGAAAAAAAAAVRRSETGLLQGTGRLPLSARDELRAYYTTLMDKYGLGGSIAW
jgi:hypothetical protein